MYPSHILFCHDDEVRVTSERIEFFGNALPVRGITAAKVVECRTSLLVRGLLLALPPLLLALGLTRVTQVPPPAGAFGWGFAVLGLVLGGGRAGEASPGTAVRAPRNRPWAGDPRLQPSLPGHRRKSPYGPPASRGGHPLILSPLVHLLTNAKRNF